MVSPKASLSGNASKWKQVIARTPKHTSNLTNVIHTKITEITKINSTQPPKSKSMNTIGDWITTMRNASNPKS
jgi:hypothetical protein